MICNYLYTFFKIKVNFNRIIDELTVTNFNSYLFFYFSIDNTWFLQFIKICENINMEDTIYFLSLLEYISVV